MNLHGPVRAPESAGSGDARLTLSFDAWKDGHVAASTHTITVKPAPKLKSEPVSEKLVRSLVHPGRTASISVLRFSADGKRLFAAGYPSGVLQLWDAGTGQLRATLRAHSACISRFASAGRKSRRMRAIVSSIQPYSAASYFQKCW